MSGGSSLFMSSIKSSANKDLQENAELSDDSFAEDNTNKDNQNVVISELDKVFGNFRFIIDD